MQLRQKDFSIQQLNKAISECNKIGRGGIGDNTIIDIRALDDTNDVSVKVMYHKEKPSASCLCVILTTMHNVSTIWLSDDYIEYIVTLIKEFCKQQNIELV